MAFSSNDKFFPVKKKSGDVVPSNKEVRCNFFWINIKGETVRCIHSANQNHGPIHENGLSWVRVGAESFVDGKWIKA